MRKLLQLLVIGCSMAFISPFVAADKEEIVVEMHAVDKDGIGKRIGTVAITEADERGAGLVFTPSLTGLKPGLHGFHIHQTNSCETMTKDGVITPAGAAGSHLDPEGENRHAAPWEDGHRGDLPALYVDEKGEATQPVYKPGLQFADVTGRAIMIHANRDNYSDEPKPLGGSGPRVACGGIN